MCNAIRCAVLSSDFYFKYNFHGIFANYYVEMFICNLAYLKVEFCLHWWNTS